jgi:hypothetical protein
VTQKDLTTHKLQLSGHSTQKSKEKANLSLFFKNTTQLLDLNRKFIMTKAKTPPKSGIVAKVADTSTEKAFFDHMDTVVESAGAKGTIVIVGLDTNSDEENEDEDDEVDGEDNENEKVKENEKVDKKEKVLTSQQLSKLRYVIITENREKMLNQAIKFATGGQQNDGIMMFNTSTGNRIIMMIPKKIKAAMKLATFPLRFDSLFALTQALFEYDYWLDDNEMYGEGGQLFCI